MIETIRVGIKSVLLAIRNVGNKKIVIVHKDLSTMIIDIPLFGKANYEKKEKGCFRGEKIKLVIVDDGGNEK